jgi:hypothetical protein
MSSEDWDGARYAREKRNFIESRLQLRGIYFHAALIFTATWLAGWLFSFILLKMGMASMPLRYAISFVLSYGVFVGCVRWWADFMRDARGEPMDWGSSFDVPSADAEGCLIALAALVLGMVAATIFTVLGGLPLLLEVAFEIVFAGVVVRRISRKHRVGDWIATLVRRTWIHATCALLMLVALAAVLQSQVPAAQTFGQAVRVLMAR